MKARIVPALIGIALIAAAVALLVVHPLEWSSELRWGDHTIEVPWGLPLHFFLALLGGGLVFSPVLTIRTLAVATPRGLSKWLEGVADKIKGLLTLKKGPPSKESDLQESIAKKFDEIDERYYRTILTGTGVLLLSVFGLAAILPVLVDHRAEARHSTMATLCATIQDQPITFAASDAFRVHLRELEDLGPDRGDTIEERLHRVLSVLYSEEVTDDAEFNVAIESVYSAYIYDDYAHPSGVLVMDRLLQSLPSGEADARASYLTLLASICNQLGNQGKAEFLSRYLQAEQLAKAALAIGDSEATIAIASGAHNALGVSYADRIRCYDAYKKLFRSGSDEDQRIRREQLGENHPLSEFELAYKANEQYEQELATGRSMYTNARSLNNRADLGVFLLRQVYLENASLENEPLEVRKYVESVVGPDPSEVVSCLVLLEADLSKASRTGLRSVSVFTLAQLHSVVGELQAAINIEHDYWGDKKVLAHEAFRYLAMAHRMAELDPSLFCEERAKALFLEWLWEQGPYQEALASLCP